MGTQFWWFYDVAAAAVILVCLFICGKKGAIKSLLAATCCIMATFVAFSVSGGLSESLYKGNIRDSHVTKIEKVIDEDTLSAELKEYLESLNYNLVADEKRINQIIDSGKDLDSALYTYANNINGKKVADEEEFLKKLHEGYAQIVKKIIGRELNGYAAECAAESILDDPSQMQELAPLMRIDERQKEAAEFMTDHFAAPAYRTILRLIAFFVLMFVVVFIAFFVIKTFSTDTGFVSTLSHIVGGIVGLPVGGVIVFTVSAIIRLWTILGNNEMMFFNTDAIDKTFVFKYFYDFVLKLK